MNEDDWADDFCHAPAGDTFTAKGFENATCSIMCPCFKYAEIMTHPRYTEGKVLDPVTCCGSQFTSQRGHYWRAACLYWAANPVPPLTQFLCALPLHVYLRREMYPDDSWLNQFFIAWCCSSCTLAQAWRSLETPPAAKAEPEKTTTAPPAAVGSMRYRAFGACESDYCTRAPSRDVLI